MTAEGAVAGSPAELDDWLSRHPDLRERLVSGGYGTNFTADDLYPLLMVFMGGAPASTAGAPASTTTPKMGWVVIAVVVLAVLAVTFALLA